MIIEEEFGNDYYGNLIIKNYPNLQSIVVKKNSLQNLNSLKICNCEKLKTIEIENSGFENVDKVIVESISTKFYFNIYLPKLRSIITGNDSFHETTSLSLSGNSIKF